MHKEKWRELTREPRSSPSSAAGSMPAEWGRCTAPPRSSRTYRAHRAALAAGKGGPTLLRVQAHGPPPDAGASPAAPHRHGSPHVLRMLEPHGQCPRLQRARYGRRSCHCRVPRQRRKAPPRLPCAADSLPRRRRAAGGRTRHGGAQNPSRVGIQEPAAEVARHPGADGGSRVVIFPFRESQE